MNIKFILVVLCISLIFTACNHDTRKAGRSGTYHDDNVETPILDDFKEYEPALKTSNTIIDLLKTRDYQVIADNYILEEIQPLLNAEKIRDVMIKAEEKYGKIVRYKPMQWGFEPKTDNGKRDKSDINRKIAEKYGDKKVGKKIPILFSVKIVEHERATLNYWLQFPADGKYTKIMGIFFKEKKGTRHIGQI